MSTQTKTWLSANSGDLAMMYMTVVAGLNFVVVRDAVTSFSPLVFNALRFALASCIIVPLLIYRIPRMKITWRDFAFFGIITGLTMTFMQLMLVNSLSLTSASNSSLMMATGPAWTILLTVFLGKLRFNRYLLLGLVVMFSGTSMVILSGEDGLAISHNDLVGSGMMLAGAIVAAAYVVFMQPVIERNNSVDLSVIKHTSISLGMLILASPQLVQIRPSDIPVNVLPNIAFAGLIASISGTMTSTFAQRKIGAARMKVYDNIMPIAAAIFAFILLREPLTVLQVVGIVMTLAGVMTVRRFAKNIPAPEARRKSVKPVPVPSP